MADEIGIHFRVDDSEIVEGMSNYAKYQEQIKEGNDELQKKTKDTFSKSKEQIDKNSKALKDGEKATGDYTASTKELGSVVKNEAKNMRLFGVNIGGVVTMFSRWKAQLVSVAAGLRTGAGALKLFRVALVSTGIGAIVVALGTLITYLTRFQKGMDLVSKVTASVGAVFDVLLDRIASVGGAIVKFLRGDFKGAWEDTKTAVSGVADEINRVAAAAYELERAEHQLRDRRIRFIEREAEARRNLAKERLTAEDETKPIEARIAASRRALSIERELLAERLSQAKEEARIAEERAGLAVNDAEANRELAEAKAQVFRVEEASFKAQRRYTMEIERIQKEAAAAARKRAQERQKAIEEYNKALEQVQDTLEKNRIEGLIGVERLKAERDLAIKEIDKLEEELKKKAKEAGKEYTAGEDFIQLRKQVEVEFQNELLNIRIESQEEQILNFLEFADRELNKRQEVLDKKRELALSEVDLIEESADEALSLEEYKEKQKLIIQQNYLKEQLELLKARYGEDSDEVLLVENQVELIDQKLSKIGEGVDLSVLDSLKQKMQDILGLDDEQFAAVEEAFMSTFSNIAGMFTAITDKAIRENERLLESIRERIAETESLLEEELEKQEQGYANNVEAKQRELAKIKAEEKQAEKERQELRKRQLKQQLAADIAQQASSLATTAAGLFQSFSKIPLGLGIPLAIAAIVGMYSTFKKYKNEASQIADTKLFKGGPVDQVLAGRTDKGSGRGHRVEDSNLVLGGDEFVVEGTKSKRDRPFLEKYNRGEFDHIDIQKTLKVGELFQKGFISTPSLTLQQAKHVQGMNEEIGRESRSDQSQMDYAIEKAMDKHLEGMKRYFDNKPDYISKGEKGYIEKKKGHTTHIDFA